MGKKYSVDLHFAANGVTSEIDEYIDRYFDSYDEAWDCYSYAWNDSTVCTGARITEYSEDYTEEKVLGEFGSYAQD